MAINKTYSPLPLFILFAAVPFLWSLAIGGGLEVEEVAQNGAADNPYYFNRSSFQTFFSSADGVVKQLPPFTQQIFAGIANARLFTLETAPRTFVMPHHSDAAAVFFILRGHGIINLVSQERKYEFNVKQGDVVRLASAVIRYAYNVDSTQRLRIAMLFLPVNAPGIFQNFFIPGLDGQEAYLRMFSPRVLTSSLNVSINLIDEVLREQKGVAIIRPIPSGQMTELSQLDTTSVGEEQSSSSSGKFSVFSQGPLYSNEFGQYYEASPDQFHLLRDLGISVNLINMTQGSTFVPHFETKATLIVFVDTGCATFEMTAFNSSGALTLYEANVCEEEAYVIPGGHPFALTTTDQNFTALAFGVNALNNSRSFLAGQANILRKLERPALKLAFGMEPEVAERAFTSQIKSYFVGTTAAPRPECS